MAAASTGGHEEHPSDVNNSTTTGRSAATTMAGSHPRRNRLRRCEAAWVGAKTGVVQSTRVSTPDGHSD